MLEKEIIIKDENDLLKFYKNIKWYKSFFFKNTRFVSNNETIKNIISALNIKNRKDRIKYVYDKSCIEIDNYWKDINVCGFKDGKCYTQQYSGCKYKNGCCRKCIYQSSNGCTTANLTCKLYYCTEVTTKYKVLTIKDLDLLRLLSIRQRIILKHDFFSSREEVLKDLYIGSILIFIIRIMYRYIFKNII